MRVQPCEAAAASDEGTRGRVGYDPRRRDPDAEGNQAGDAVNELGQVCMDVVVQPLDRAAVDAVEGLAEGDVTGRRKRRRVRDRNTLCTDGSRRWCLLEPAYRRERCEGERLPAAAGRQCGSAADSCRCDPEGKCDPGPPRPGRPNRALCLAPLGA
jgi:hypothetical protein